MYSVSCETSKMEALAKELMAFSHLLFLQTLHLRCLGGFDYASGLLRLLCHGCKRDTWEDWYMPNKLTPNYWIFPCSEVIHGSTTFKLKKKWSTIKFDVFAFCFIFFIPLSRQKFDKQKWLVLFLHASK